VTRVALLGFTLCVAALASPVQAMTVRGLESASDMVVSVRAACGAGYQRVAGRCVRNTAVRHYRRAVRRQ
jgi:hypothetical protein